MENNFYHLQAKVSAIEATIPTIKENVERHDKALIRIDDKLDKVIFWMTTASVGTLGSFIIGIIMLLLKG